MNYFFLLSMYVPIVLCLAQIISILTEIKYQLKENWRELDYTHDTVHDILEEIDNLELAIEGMVEVKEEDV